MKPRKPIHRWITRGAALSLGAMLATVLPAGASSLTESPPQNDLVLLGGLDNLRHFDKQAFGAVQERFAASYYDFQPLVHAGIAHGGSVYGGVGVFYELKLARHVWLTVDTGPGLYRHRGNDPRLGCAVEFASWVELSTRVMGRRVGISLGHLSNAHLSPHNPGTETLGITVHGLRW
jgi:hypothetical protein